MDLCKYVIKLFGKPNNIIDAEIIKINRIVEEQNKYMLIAFVYVTLSKI